MKKNLLIFLIASPLFALALMAIRIYYSVAIWSYDGNDKPFTIKSGEAFASINYRLHKEGLIGNKKLFHHYAKVNGTIKKFKAGTFIINKNSNMLQVIDTLIHGPSLAIKVTIPEGKNLYEVAKKLSAMGITPFDEFVKVAKDPKFTQLLQVHGPTFEGHLYPDTYNLNPHSTPREIIKMMVANFNKKVKDIPFHQLQLSKQQIITLASIVEKETGAAFERPIIAGVFLNRLKKGMRLQSDPTTIYGIYEHFDGNLRKKHLLAHTPYNTYKIKGLPIGPIANPGRKAISAVLGPTKHQYLYFVSKNDGTHAFSKTYKEHLKAVQKWQMTRANRKGKSWRDLNTSPQK